MPAFLLVFILLTCPASLLCQESYKSLLENIKGLTVKEIAGGEFKKCYEIMLEQPLDHFNKSSPTFKQQVIVGINSIEAPVVMITEGYALGKPAKPDFMKDCNVVYVEHRFFGKSKPDTMDWNFLTIRQAAFDLHEIHRQFSKIFSGKWLTSGASKSGQMSIAYKMYFPEDADATIAYATPLKSSANDNRITEYLDLLLKSECGKKVTAFQKFIFRNKNVMYKEFERYAATKNYTFNKTGSQKAFEYMILEYPFSFFQNCYDCRLIPDTSSSSVKIIEELTTVVPPQFYSDAFSAKLEPSFYMFYHELGYYEYNISPFKQWLSDNAYPNSIFCPLSPQSFDNSYLSAINKFISDPKTGRIIFIYGENDPYTGAQPLLKGKQCLKMVVKNGCHKSRMDALDNKQKQEAYSHLSDWLHWPVGK